MQFHRSDDRPLLYFYIRRFFRIAPLFYALLLAWILIYIYIKNPFNIYDLTINLLFLFNIFPNKQDGMVGASWVIGVLILFYLIFPLLHKIFKNIGTCIIFIFLSLLLAYWAESLLNPMYFKLSFIRHLPILAIGMFVFYLLNIIPQIRRKRIIGVTLICLSFLLFIILLRGELKSYYWQGILFSALLLGISLNPFKIIVNNLTIFLGEISYSMYLCHPLLIPLLTPFYRIIYKLSIPLSVKYIIVVTVTFALLISISYIAYCLIEKPGINFGKIIRQRFFTE
jgi:peptidoglycan/LPS O-acetylase OafA/YrhL